MPYAFQLKGNVFQTFLKGLSHNAIPFIKCYSFIKRFACLMEEQIPSSNFPPEQQGLGGQITPEQLEQLKARAREAAIMQTYQQQQPQAAPPAGPPVQVVYIKKPLTVAEGLLLLLVSCGIVFGAQLGFNFALDTLSRIEVKMK
jgi:hypothetical protein